MKTKQTRGYLGLGHLLAGLGAALFGRLGFAATLFGAIERRDRVDRHRRLGGRLRAGRRRGARARPGRGRAAVADLDPLLRVALLFRRKRGRKRRGSKQQI